MSYTFTNNPLRIRELMLNGFFSQTPVHVRSLLMFGDAESPNKTLMWREPKPLLASTPYLVFIGATPIDTEGLREQLLVNQQMLGLAVACQLLPGIPVMPEDPVERFLAQGSLLAAIPDPEFIWETWGP